MTAIEHQYQVDSIILEIINVMNTHHNHHNNEKHQHFVHQTVKTTIRVHTTQFTTNDTKQISTNNDTCQTQTLPHCYLANAVILRLRLSWNCHYASSITGALRRYC